LEHLLRAVAIDSTFVTAKLQLAQAYVGIFEEPAADSIVDVFERRAREPDAAPATLAGLDDFLEERRSRWRISGA
jgi:hypothetical protein